MNKRRFNIPLRVRNLIARCGTRDPWRIADDLGITVISCPLPPGVMGFKDKNILRRRYAFVDPRLNEHEQSITLAHETAHFVLHNGRDLSLIAGEMSRHHWPQDEREADVFALFLLCDLSGVDRRIFPAILDPYATTDAEFRDFIRRHLYLD